MIIFFNNMVKLIQTNILSYHLLKSVNKRKNGELNLFFASLLCRKCPHPIFFSISIIFLYFCIWPSIKNNLLKYQFDISKKNTDPHLWAYPPPFSRNPKNPKNYPKMSRANFFFFFFFFHNLN